MRWKKSILGDISSNIQTGPFGAQLHQSDYSECGIPVVMPKDLICGKITENSIARVGLSHVERLTKHKIANGDILYSRRGDVGRCALAGEKEEGWLCGTGCLRVTIDSKKAIPKFVFYQLQSADSVGWVEKHAVGSTMLNLNTTILSKVPVKLPALGIQHRIADILSAYDDLIENNRKQIKLLEEAAQRLYKEWFVDLHFPGWENTAIVDGLPEGWRKIDIESLCIKIAAGGTPKRNNKSYWDSKDVKWYKTGELIDDWLIESEEYISEEGLKNSVAKLFPKDTILMAIYASPTLGRLGILADEAACNQAALGLIVNDEITTWQWLFQKLLELREDFNALARGAGQQNISSDVVKRRVIILPKYSLIQAYTNFVRLFWEKKFILSNNNRLLVESRDRLLPKLMSGELEVG